MSEHDILDGIALSLALNGAPVGVGRRLVPCDLRGNRRRRGRRTAPVAQPAEAGHLKGFQCGFESHRGHEKPNPPSHAAMRATSVATS